MYQPEDDFDLENSIDKSNNSQADNSNENLSVDNIQEREQQLKQIFFKLIAFGLVAGVILSIGTVILLKKYGLADKPSPKMPKQLPGTEIKFSPH